MALVEYKGNLSILELLIYLKKTNNFLELDWMDKLGITSEKTSSELRSQNLV